MERSERLETKLKKIAEAVARVRSLDECDGGLMGLPLDLHLRTIIEALECGLLNPDTGVGWDAYVMLSELELTLREVTNGTK